MLLAVQANQIWIAIGLFILLLVSAKNKLLIFASIIGGLIVWIFYGGGYSPWIIIIGLFIVLLLVVKSSPTEPGPEMYYPPIGSY